MLISGLSGDFLQMFNRYLEKAPKGALFYAIGIVENCGSQAIYFRETLKNLKWGFIDAFKKEHRETIARIDFLESNWQKIFK